MPTTAHPSPTALAAFAAQRGRQHPLTAAKGAANCNTEARAHAAAQVLQRSLRKRQLDHLRGLTPVLERSGEDGRQINLLPWKPAKPVQQPQRGGNVGPVAARAAATPAYRFRAL